MNDPLRNPQPSAASPAPARLLLLMDHSLDFVELLGAGGVILGVSAGITAVAGYQPDELVGSHYKDFIHPDDYRRAGEAFAKILAGVPTAPITLRYRRKDGSWRTIVASARNFLADPVARAVVVLTRDVTDQLDAEASLATANKRLRHLAQQLMSAKEAERSHLSRELHDDVLQIVLGLRLNMEAARRAPREVLNAATLDLWIPLVQEVLDHLQNLTMTLRRPAVERHGLSRELRTYVDRIAARSNPAIHLNIAETLGPLTPATELACFRIVQESLSNAVKHAAATQIWASVWRTAGILKVAIRDDGVGFDPTATHAGEGGAGHLGLESMRERAALAGGRLTVESSVGTGTIISAELPTIGFESGAAAPEDG